MKELIAMLLIIGESKRVSSGKSWKMLCFQVFLVCVVKSADEYGNTFTQMIIS